MFTSILIPSENWEIGSLVMIMIWVILGVIIFKFKPAMGIAFRGPRPSPSYGHNRYDDVSYDDDDDDDDEKQ